jgi:hypothetical protein
VSDAISLFLPDDLADIDEDELATLYRAAPLFR